MARTWSRKPAGRAPDDLPVGTRVKITKHRSSARVGKIGIVDIFRAVVHDDGRSTVEWLEVEQVPRQWDKPGGAQKMPDLPDGTKVRILAHRNTSLVGMVGTTVTRDGFSAVHADGRHWCEWTQIEEVLDEEGRDEAVTDWEAMFHYTWKVLGEEANRRGWCDDYDAFARAHGGDPRPARVIPRNVTVRLTVSVPENATPQQIREAVMAADIGTATDIR